MFVVDASVIVASVSGDDPNHQSSAAWLRQTLERGLCVVAPNLLEIEVAGALRRITGSRSATRRIVSRLRRAGFPELIPLTAERASLATEIAVRAAVRGADAVYLALASELGCALVSLDRQQRRRGGEVVSVRRPWVDA